MQNLPPILLWALQRVRARWPAAIMLVFAVRLLQFIVFTPLAAAVLRLGLLRWGRASVGNFEIATFLLSPTGIAAALALGTLFLVTQYFELAGLLRIFASDRLHWWSALRSSSGLLPHLVAVGVQQLVVYGLLAIPFAAGVGLAYWLFWSASDLNGLIILRPPRFWSGAILAGLCFLAYVLFAARWFLRWLLAVPILCIETGVPVATVLSESERRTRGQLLHLASAIAAWAIMQIILGAVVAGLMRWLFLLALEHDTSSPTTAAVIGGAVVVTNAAVTSLLTALSSLTLAAIVLALYHTASPPSVDEAASVDADAAEPATGSWLARSLVWTVLAGLLITLSILSARSLVADVPLSESVELTAHRAGGLRGPENTIAALTQAISDKAAWAEIDVQLTSDNQIVVMHDTDLARVGGGKKQVGQTTLAEIQKLDVGKPFAARYQGERIATFDKFLATARDQIRLNVELKPHCKSDEEPLTRRVIEAIHAAKMVSQCRICSQSYAAIQMARKMEPAIPIGFIAATSVGDLTKLDVDFLMIKHNLATRDFVDRAHARDIQVHAWTVNDPKLVAPLLDAGVDNLITDDVVAIWQKVEEVRELDPVERLLLRVRHAVSR
jgi:glycerophosphoryl diester phosphodiesterase